MKTAAAKVVGSGFEYLFNKFAKNKVATEMLSAAAPASKFAMEEAFPVDKPLRAKAEQILEEGSWGKWNALSIDIVDKAKKNQLANQSSNSLHPTSKSFQEDFITARSLEQSNLDPERLKFEGYNPPDLEKLNEWQSNELSHWSKKGRGTGNYFLLEHATDPTKRKRIRLDSKRKFTEDGFEDVQSRQFSYKDVDVKAKENVTQQKIRGPYLRGTTTDPSLVGKPLINRPAGTIHHHAIPAQSTGKIWVAFEKYLNPNWSLSKNSRPSKQWLDLLKKAEKEFGVKFGDDPMNARYPKTKGIHDIYHDKLREYGIDPPQVTSALKDMADEPMTQNEAYRFLRKFAEAMKAIDQDMALMNIL